MRAYRGLWLCILIAGCGGEPAMSEDMAAADLSVHVDMTSTEDMSALPVDCNALCTQFATCYQSAHPEFVPGPDELQPCLTACNGDSPMAQQELAACMAKDCFIFLACATTAGLSLMSLPQDGGVTDSGPPPDMSAVMDMTAPRDLTPVD